MTTNASITVWHYDEKKETYKRSIFENVSLHNVKRISSAHNSRSGMSRKYDCKIRIPAAFSAPIFVKDYVRIGIHYDNSPDRCADMKVTEIADNCRGGVPHRRITCE